MRTKLFSFIAIVATMLFTISCSSDTVTTSEQFTLSVVQEGSVPIQEDAASYIIDEVAALESSSMNVNLSQNDAEKLTKDFMDSLVTGIQTQGYRVFEGSQLTGKLKNSTGTEVYTYTVTLIASGDPASCYMYITIEELTPAGDLTNSDKFITGLMSDYEFTKSSDYYPSDLNYVVNTYSYKKVYTDVSDAKTAYNEGSFVATFIDEVENNWPSDVVYSGKLTASSGYYDESAGTGGSGSQYYIRHSPAWATNTTWTTTDAGAKFSKLTITGMGEIEAPYFVYYTVALDGDSSAGLRLIQSGFNVLLIDSSYNCYYTFELTSTSEFKLTEIANVAVTNGAVYTK